MKIGHLEIHLTDRKVLYVNPGGESYASPDPKTKTEMVQIILTALEFLAAEARGILEESGD